MDVVSPLIALAMPKSMSFSWPSTSRKFAGLRSLCTMRCSWTPATACRAPSNNQWRQHMRP